MIPLSEQIKWIDMAIESHTGQTTDSPASESVLELMKAIKVSLERLQTQEKYLGRAKEPIPLYD